jgi:hypothetical protein
MTVWDALIIDTNTEIVSVQSTLAMLCYSEWRDITACLELPEKKRAGGIAVEKMF